MLQLIMQNSLLITTLCVISIANECQGYGPQPPQSVQKSFDTNHWPHPIYGAPPPPLLKNTAQFDNPAYAPAYPQLPVLKAVVRTLEPFGKNYEVKLSQSPPTNMESGEPHAHATAENLLPPIQYSNNHQFGYSGPKYLPPPPPQSAHPKPYYQSLTATAAPTFPHTANQNPLLTSHNSQSILPTSLIPPSTQILSNNNNPQYQPSIVAQHFANQNNQIGATHDSFNSQFRQSDNSVNEEMGNYISQSEGGQLDHYFEKQNPVGETRAYARLISTCYPDGRCDQQKLGSGQVDAKHQHIVLAARARVQPISDKCRTSNDRSYIVDQNSISGHGDVAAHTESASIKKHKSLKLTQNRPPNRRLYPYTETVLSRDPFN